MRMVFVSIIALAMIIMPAQAEPAAPDHLVVKQSPHGVDETLERLKAVLTDFGLLTFTTFDHAGDAPADVQPLPPTKVLIFGNPRAGTQLMAENRMIAIDLPMKALAWEEADGTVWIAYTKPEALAARYGLTESEPVIERMSTALDRITDRAIATD